MNPSLLRYSEKGQKVHKTEKITPAQGNPQRVKEPVQAGSKKDTDKHFCNLLEEVINKAYPHLRRIK
jgi:hypothetical protein